MPVHRTLGWLRVQYVTMQRIPHPFAIHVAPDHPQLLGLRGKQVVHCFNAKAIKSRVHAASDAWNRGQWQSEQGSRHDVWMPDRYAVRFVDFAGDLCEQTIRGETN